MSSLVKGRQTGNPFKAMSELTKDNQPAARGRSPALDRQVLIPLVFWLGLPLVWSIPTLYYGVQTGEAAGPPFETLAVIVHVYIMWACAFGATWLLARVPVLRQANPYILIFIGGLLGITLVARYAIRALLLFRVSFAENSEYLRSQIYEAAPYLFELSWDFFMFLGEAYWYRVFCWTVSAWFFFASFRIPHFGLQFRPLASAAQTSETEPFILTKLKPELGRDILALKAEGHFTRVFTPVGDELVYYKFGDAVAQMSNTNGTQVHRSYWIKTENLTAAKAPRGKVTLTLANGLTVPIGQTYLHHLRSQGIID